MASLKVPSWVISIFPKNYIIPNIGLHKGSKPMYYTQTTHFSPKNATLLESWNFAYVFLTWSIWCHLYNSVRYWSTW